MNYQILITKTVWISSLLSLGQEEFNTFPTIFVQEEELRARKREALMQQSRREATLSRLRFEEERLKVIDSWNNFTVNLYLEWSLVGSVHQALNAFSLTECLTFDLKNSVLTI